MSRRTTSRVVEKLWFATTMSQGTTSSRAERLYFHLRWAGFSPQLSTEELNELLGQSKKTCLSPAKAGS
jgi:hypothetical protein